MVDCARWGTIRSFACKVANEFGADYAELDVRQTKDGHFILMHDTSVNRTTNGVGRVKDMTLNEIKQLDAGITFDHSFIGERVPTLNEVLNFSKNLPIKIDIDFKSGNVADLVNLLKKHNAMDRVIIYSFSHKNLSKLKKLAPKVKLRVGKSLGNLMYKNIINNLSIKIINFTCACYDELNLNIV